MGLVLNTKLITQIVLAVGAAAWLIWDLVVNFNLVTGDTISEVIAEMTRSAPLIALAMGIICGHFFGDWPAIKPVLDFLTYRPIIAFLYGVLGGLLFWNMAR